MSVRLIDAPRARALDVLADLAGVDLTLAPGIDGQVSAVVRSDAIDALARVADGAALVDVDASGLDVVPISWGATLSLPADALVPGAPWPVDEAMRLPGNTVSVNARGTMRISGHPRFVERVALSRLLP